MATAKKITRKVISSFSKKKDEAPKPDDKISSTAPPAEPKFTRSKRECLFCQKKLTPTYLDLANLRRFLTDRSKIVGRERSGVCSKHQRGVAKNIKYARHLALLPFVPKV